jgi:hypothetical protein
LASLQKCHESGQKLKLDNMNEWYMVNLLNLFKYLPSLEKIQERALSFIYNDYNSTYENLLIVSKLPTLKTENYGHWGL